MRLGIVPSFQKSDTLRKSSVHEFAIVKKEKEKKERKKTKTKEAYSDKNKRIPTVVGLSIESKEFADSLQEIFTTHADRSLRPFCCFSVEHRIASTSYSFRSLVQSHVVKQ